MDTGRHQFNCYMDNRDPPLTGLKVLEGLYCPSKFCGA